MSLQVDFFRSFRSPYSYLAVSRVIALEFQLERFRRTDYSGCRQRSRIQLVVQRQHVPDVLNVPGFVCAQDFVWLIPNSAVRPRGLTSISPFTKWRLTISTAYSRDSARGCTADIVTTYTLDAKNVARILRWGARVHRSGKTAASTVEKTAWTNIDGLSTRRTSYRWRVALHHLGIGCSEAFAI